MIKGCDSYKSAFVLATLFLGTSDNEACAFQFVCEKIYYVTILVK